MIAKPGELARAFDHPELFAEKIIGCDEISLYHAWKGRNAWHTTWRSQYWGSRSFFLDFASAKAAVERGRCQGTVWRIARLPACAFVSQNSTRLILCEFNGRYRLSDLKSFAPQAATVDAILTEVDAIDANFLAKLVSDQTPELFHKSGGVYRAIGVGSNAPFSWLRDGDVLQATKSMRRFVRMARLWLQTISRQEDTE